MGIHGKKTLSVYIHIPFCLSKCPYCDFVSKADAPVPEGEYVESLLRELSAVAGEEGLIGRTLEAIYLGGGTPSIFSAPSIERLVSSAKGAFAPGPECEVTIEANPETVSVEKLKGFKASANRLSIGAQSFTDKNLKTLGRAHTAAKAVEAFKAAREAGFKNIGIDLIFGIPGQTLKEWEEDLNAAAALRPEHLSLYCLTLEDSTPFYRTYINTRFRSEEEEASMYTAAQRVLKEAGYMQYEISNWSLPGFESVHNRRYWTGMDYIGLGASAHSYISTPDWGRRWWNEKGIDDYVKRVASVGRAKAGGETLSREEAAFETLILGLRMLDFGVDGHKFKEQYGIYPKDAFPDFAALEDGGYLISRGEDILLTEKGALISNEIFLKPDIARPLES